MEFKIKHEMEIIKKYAYRGYNIICNIIRKSIRRIRITLYSERKALIKSPETLFNIVSILNSEKWEDICLPPIYNISKEIRSSLLYKKQFILDIENAIIYDNSNLIITEKGVVWNKSYNEDFTIIVPLDYGLVNFNKTKVRFEKMRHSIKIEGKTLSLLGVHSMIWSHFLIQYLPKLYYAEKYRIIKEPITLIIPQYRDIHIKQILNYVLSRNTNIVVMESKPNTAYYCDHLIHIPETAYCGDHANIVHVCETLIPRETFDILIANLVVPLVKNVVKDKKYNKLYLIRRGTYRSLINYEEIESFFSKLGFVLIEPHKLSLEEKVKAFYSAEFIAGPVSAGFTNMIFSHSKTRVLLLSSLSRALDGYTAGFAFHKGMHTLRVTGDDLDSTIHSSYYIDINRVKAAYNQLINNGQ